MEVQICPVNHQRSPFPQLPGSAADCWGDKNTTFIWKTAVSQAALQLEAGLQFHSREIYQDDMKYTLTLETFPHQWL